MAGRIINLEYVLYLLFTTKSTLNICLSDTGIVFDSIDVTTPAILRRHITFTLNTERNCSTVHWRYTYNHSTHIFNAAKHVVMTSIEGTHVLTLIHVSSAYNRSVVSFECDGQRVDHVTLNLLGKLLCFSCLFCNYIIVDDRHNGTFSRIIRTFFGRNVLIFIPLQME